MKFGEILTYNQNKSDSKIEIFRLIECSSKNKQTKFVCNFSAKHINDNHFVDSVNFFYSFENNLCVVYCYRRQQKRLEILLTFFRCNHFS